MISEKANETAQQNEAFAEIYGFLACLWHGLRDEEPLVQPLVKLCYDLECSITPDGTELLPLVANLEPAEEAQRLTRLGAGRVRFKVLLLEGLPQLPGIGVRNLVFAWARLQYEHVHCFQAPLRLDRKQAALDAMGLSDHFAELAIEVLDVVDPDHKTNV